MFRCKECILPSNYPGVTFNEQGVCNYCAEYKPPEYKNEELLLKKVRSLVERKKDRNSSIDCVVGFSGGRDSSYLLWYSAKKLGLRVIAYTADNGYVPEIAMRNISNIACISGVEVVIEKHTYLMRCIKHHLNAWMHKPSPAMTGVICVGCKLGIDLGLMQFAKKNKIPLILSGGSPIEVGSYKTNLMRGAPNRQGQIPFILGYMSQIRKNPRWIFNLSSIRVQALEFYHHYFRETLHRNERTLKPFNGYIKWDEQEIVSTLMNKLGWEYDPDLHQSTWKTDCHIAVLKNYLF